MVSAQGIRTATGLGRSGICQVAPYGWEGCSCGETVFLLEKKQALLAMQDANMVQSFLFPQANRDVAKGFPFHP